MKYTREIAEEVLNDFNEYNDNILHDTIEEFLDDKFPPPLPEKGWLKSQDGAIVYRTGARIGYGVNYRGEWDKSEGWTFLSEPGVWQPATEEEVKDALINFARKQGYKNGNYKCLVGDVYTQEVKEDIIDIDDNFYVWHGEEEYGDQNLVFNSDTGEWAKIIEDGNKH